MLVKGATGHQYFRLQIKSPRIICITNGDQIWYCELLFNTPNRGSEAVPSMKVRVVQREFPAHWAHREWTRPWGFYQWPWIGTVLLKGSRRCLRIRRVWCDITVPLSTIADRWRIPEFRWVVPKLPVICIKESGTAEYHERSCFLCTMYC